MTAITSPLLAKLLHQCKNGRNGRNALQAVEYHFALDSVLVSSAILKISFTIFVFQAVFHVLVLPRYLVKFLNVQSGLCGVRGLCVQQLVVLERFNVAEYAKLDGIVKGLEW